MPGLSILLLPSTPPKILVEVILTFTSLGTRIVIPPKIALASITTSSLMIAFLKSHLIPPKTASNFVPVNSSLEKSKFCPLKVAL